MKILSIISIISIALIPSSANAASFLRICTATGNCRICDIVASAITLGQWLITGAAGLALLVIVWAAFGFITAAGNPEKIGESKKQITGAIFGMAITMVSFQLISWIIFAFVVPSELNSPNLVPAKAEESGERANLKSFLGTPWWSICDERDLRATNGTPSTKFGSTADCKYWGDGTICSKFNKSQSATDVMKICLDGECIDPLNEKIDPIKGETATDQKKMDKYLKKLGKKIKPIKNACDFLSAVDLTYENYECATHDTSKNGVRECNTTKTIEEDFCPGTGTIVCCVKN